MSERVTWDYTSLAAHYDKRAPYADSAIDAMLAHARPRPDQPIADIGAGTGILTRALAARGFRVHSVEPNEAMRTTGQRNTAALDVTWSVGQGEATGLSSSAYDLVTFGSSFNVTDRPKALRETTRILRDRGWFACMWNHRDLNDPIQQACEKIITDRIPGYSYGSRREDQTEVIRESGLFEEPIFIEGTTIHEISREDFVEAWRSHATLQRQAGDQFAPIVAAIADALEGASTIRAPYTTRLWCARKK